MLLADSAVRMWIVTHRVAALDAPLRLISSAGRGGVIWLAIAGLLAVARRRPRTFVRVALAIAVASAITNLVVKPAVGRPRPFDVLAGTVIGIRPTDASFPSGHSANACAGAWALTRVAPAGAAAWWTLAAIIAFSRVYLGVHYPLDVIGGALVGVTSGWLALRWGTWLERRF